MQLAVVLSCVDPWGREIRLDDHVWNSKIVRGGARLPPDALDAVKQALEAPDFIMQDKTHADGECFYAADVLAGVLSHLYLKVCVKIETMPGSGRDAGRVVTAYPTDRIPRRERQKWP